MLKAIAIDDEPLALNVIESFCGMSDYVSLEKTFTSPNEGLKYIHKFPVDLVFLDIQMPALTGIELAKCIKEEVTVIFTTAFDSFALQGYNLNAVDYLLKPFTQERFNVAVAKAVKLNASKFTQNEKLNFITVRADYSLVKIELNAIRYIEGLDDYIKIHLHNAKTVVTRYTMKSILETLPENQFLRVHRSFIVPLNKIKAVKNRVVVLEDTELPLGQSFESKVLKYFS